ncbi:hypothetical protein J6590_060802 [Homalodisca vitripennis]|nr:hypothetical protein J6590_060802 [Homalodisca vitripennis]
MIPRGSELKKHEELKVIISAHRPDCVNTENAVPTVPNVRKCALTESVGRIRHHRNVLEFVAPDFLSDVPKVRNAVDGRDDAVGARSFNSMLSTFRKSRPDLPCRPSGRAALQGLEKVARMVKRELRIENRVNLSGSIQTLGIITAQAQSRA